MDAIFVDRLAPDTLLLDAQLSDGNSQPAPVSSVFDPPTTSKFPLYTFYDLSL
jgi:hypothetical protein